MPAGQVAPNKTRTNITIEKELKEILDGMRDDAKIFCGLEEDGNMYKVTSYEYPSGDKSTWEFINLAHE